MLGGIAFVELARADPATLIGSFAFEAVSDRIRIDEPTDSAVWRLLDSRLCSIVVVEAENRPRAGCPLWMSLTVSVVGFAGEVLQVDGDTSLGVDADLTAVGWGLG
jgi:hypothetical protein